MRHIHKLVKTKLSQYLAILGLLCANVGILAAFPLTAQAANIAPAGTYTDIVMPGKDLTNIGHDVTVNKYDSPEYFWSHQFNFMSPPAGGGAYFGIQGINKAVFSVFAWPSPEVSPNCKVIHSGFDGGAVSDGGTSCLIDYTITPGHTYHLEVTDTGHNANGIVWQATVKDVASGQTAVIANINVPLSWGELSPNSVVWSEYFRANSTPLSACTQVPFSNVTFSNFSANKGQYTAPLSHFDHISQNDCTPYSRITDNSADSFTQEMGLSTPASSNFPNGDGSPGSELPPLPGISGTTGRNGTTCESSQIKPNGLSEEPNYYCVETKTDETLKGKCPDKYKQDANGGCGIVERYINPIIRFISMGIGVVVAIMIAIGGLQYSSAGGDPQQVAAAKRRIFNAIFALVGFGLLYAFLNFIIPGGL